MAEATNGQNAGIPRVLLVEGGETAVELVRRLGNTWQITCLAKDISSAEAALADIEDGPVFVEGDATARLVLERAGAEGVDLAVVMSGGEEALAALELLQETFACSRPVVLLREAAMRPRFEAIGAEVVPCFEANAAALASRLSGASRNEASGAGRGEMMEIEVLPNSSVIGKPLSALHPRKWLVASIHREGELIIPHGDTILAAGDRVLLIGDPRILPSVARFIRTGHSEFPLHYGTAVVVPVTPSTAAELPELVYMMQSTMAESLEFITCDAAEEESLRLNTALEEAEFLHHFSCLGGTLKESMSILVQDRDVGILTLSPEPIGFWRRIGLGRTKLAERMRKVDSPVLIPRGTFPYERVLYVITDDHLDLDAAILAIDTARNFGAELTVAAAIPPDFVSGEALAERMRDALREVKRLAASYNQRVNLLELSGNPVRSILAECGDAQLLVMGYHKDRRPSPARPDPEQNLFHRASCSVLVLPHTGCR